MNGAGVLEASWVGPRLIRRRERLAVRAVDDGRFGRKRSRFANGDFGRVLLIIAAVDGVDVDFVVDIDVTAGNFDLAVVDIDVTAVDDGVDLIADVGFDTADLTRVGAGAEILDGVDCHGGWASPSLDGFFKSRTGNWSVLGNCMRGTVFIDIACGRRIAGESFGFGGKGFGVGDIGITGGDSAKHNLTIGGEVRIFSHDLLRHALRNEASLSKTSERFARKASNLFRLDVVNGEMRRSPVALVG